MILLDFGNSGLGNSLTHDSIVSQLLALKVVCLQNVLNKVRLHSWMISYLLIEYNHKIHLKSLYEENHFCPG